MAGRRPDGTPNLSHAWARTIAGAQGGTWTQVHLLASLEGVARVAVASGQEERGVRLLGSTAAHREAFGTPLPPHLRRGNEDTLAAAQSNPPVTIADLLANEIPFLILAVTGVGLLIRREPRETARRLGLDVPRWRERLMPHPTTRSNGFESRCHQRILRPSQHRQGMDDHRRKSRRRLEPVPYSLPAITISGVPSPWYSCEASKTVITLLVGTCSVQAPAGMFWKPGSAGTVPHTQPFADI